MHPSQAATVTLLRGVFVKRSSSVHVFIALTTHGSDRLHRLVAVAYADPAYCRYRPGTDRCLHMLVIYEYLQGLNRHQLPHARTELVQIKIPQQ